MGGFIQQRQEASSEALEQTTISITDLSGHTTLLTVPSTTTLSCSETTITFTTTSTGSQITTITKTISICQSTSSSTTISVTGSSSSSVLVTTTGAASPTSSTEPLYVIPTDTSKTIIGAVVGSIGGILVLLVVCWIILRCRRHRRTKRKHKDNEKKKQALKTKGFESNAGNGDNYHDQSPEEWFTPNPGTNTARDSSLRINDATHAEKIAVLPKRAATYSN